MLITGYKRNMQSDDIYTVINPIESQKTVIRRALKHYLKSDLMLSKKDVEAINDILKESK